MFAETVHTIFEVLPESEQKRFLGMVSKLEKNQSQKQRKTIHFQKIDV